MSADEAQEDPSQDNESSENSEDEGSGGAAGFIGKILGWVIVIAIGLGIGVLRGGQKDKWFEQQHQLSKMWCSGDSQCLAVVEKEWKSCIEDNYDSYKKGKFNRKYDLDEANYRECLIAAGAQKLAAR